jgi:GNAT superfamily N-acetyltransferase
LLDDARRRGVREILLGTTERFLAAHRFYERNGFQPIDAAALPPEFPRMAVDTRFYRLTLT